MTTPEDGNGKEAHMGTKVAGRKMVDVVGAAKVAKRPAHEMNDRAVTLRAGAEAPPHYKGHTTLRGGTGRAGYIWTVVGDKALCDFGPDVLVLARLADLEVLP